MSTCLALPPELTIYAVGELRPAWLAWAATADADSVVDGMEVDSVDAAGVQLLMSLSRLLEARQLPLQIANASNPLADACRALGAGGLLPAAQANGATA